MISVALLPLSAKPLHSGHFSLIQMAAQENDSVILFVSLSDRERPNETIIRGSDMALIWKNHLSNIMPANVNVVYLVDESPIKRIYKVLGSVDPFGNDKFIIYGDPDDISINFSESAIKKYLNDFHGNGRLEFRKIPRTHTVDISGTKMRQWLEDGNMSDFIKHLPPGVDTLAIWQILRKRFESNVLSSFIQQQ